MKRVLVGILLSLSLLAVSPASLLHAEPLTPRFIAITGGATAEGMIVRSDDVVLVPLKGIHVAYYNAWEIELLERNIRRPRVRGTNYWAKMGPTSIMGLDPKKDTFIFNYETGLLEVFTEAGEFIRERKLGIPGVGDHADWKIAVSGERLWIWDGHEQRLHEFATSTLEHLGVIEGIPGEAESIEMTAGMRRELYIRSGPFLMQITDGRIARQVSLRRFDISPDDSVGLTVFKDGAVYAVVPSISSALIFDSFLFGNRIVELKHFEDAERAEILATNDALYIHDVEVAKLWVYPRPTQN